MKNRFLIQTKTKRHGFTLIELLVVIAIIGILSSIVMTSLNGAREKARDSARLSDIRQIQVALELYHGQNGNEYPIDLDDAGLNAFLSSIPNDPKTGADYNYIGIQNDENRCEGYHLGATLENVANPALDDDDDANSTTETDCNGIQNAGFDGSDDSNNAIYDIKI